MSVIDAAAVFHKDFQRSGIFHRGEINGELFVSPVEGCDFLAAEKDYRVIPQSFHREFAGRLRGKNGPVQNVTVRLTEVLHRQSILGMHRTRQDLKETCRICEDYGRDGNSLFLVWTSP